MTTDAEKGFRDLKKRLYRATKDENIRKALRRAVSSFRNSRNQAFEKFPEVKEKRKLLRERKEYVLTHLDEMIQKTMESVEAMKGHAYFARDSEEACKIIDSIVGSGKTVVKAKSITSEELDLNEHLEERGNRVFETDLGEFIVQLMHGRPMHILAPAINIPREKVAEVFSQVAGREIPPDPAQLTQFAREFLREKFFTAEVGISGANALVAETGSVFLIENEGNIRLATGAPPVYIALVGIEKILPTLSDGMLLVEVASRYAGYMATSFISIISGPSKTGDIEKVVVYGAHGPKEFHVILLDNGRSEMAKDPVLREGLYCLRCGACMYECSIYPLTSGHWGHKYMGGIGIPWTACVAGGLEMAGPMAYACTLCGRCVKYCPMEADTPRVVERIRELMAKEGFMPEYVRKMAENVMTKGSPY